LPDPELNPLLNPLLAAHMGRWAEVYFTSPPEKREEAVAELIRELKRSPSEDHAPGEAAHEPSKDGDEPPEVVTATHTGEPLRTCVVCTYRNSPGQSFCGMCGAPLQLSPEPHVSRVAETVPTESTRRAPEPFFGDDSEHAAEPVYKTPEEKRSHNIQQPSWSLPENDLPHFAMEPEPVPYRYRLYVGAALAILLVTLAYMAWRGTKSFSGTAGPESVPSKVIPPAPPATAQQPRATPSNSAAGNAPATPLPTRIQPDAVPVPQKSRTADARPASKIVTRASISSSIPPEQSGTQDFATAQRYLNDTQGSARDSREAALWLWKAVGKGNAAATLALSDLYLRGDGVPKSCDQARLLLDVAARKGAKGAGERLRNLQAFGCQ